MKVKAMKRLIMAVTRVVSNNNGYGNMARAMAMATRVVGEQKQGQWRRGQLLMATMRAIVMAMRVVTNKEGEGNKAMVTVTRMAGKQRDGVKEGSGNGRQGGGQG